MQHGPFALPTIWYLKPPQVQQYLEGFFFFDIPYIANWKKIGDYRQCQTDLNTKRENNSRIDYDYKVGGKVLVWKNGIPRKTESRYDNEPWTITSVHTNGTIRVEQGSKSERLNIRRASLFLNKKILVSTFHKSFMLVVSNRKLSTHANATPTWRFFSSQRFSSSYTLILHLWGRVP
jgi:hypothetical protein